MAKKKTEKPKKEKKQKAAPDPHTEHTGIMHYTLMAAGSVSLSFGLFFLWTPIPLSMPLVTIGSIILIKESRSFRRWLRHRRENNPPVDGFFRMLQKKLPTKFAKPLRRTNPQKPPDQA